MDVSRDRNALLAAKYIVRSNILKFFRGYNKSLVKYITYSVFAIKY